MSDKAEYIILDTSFAVQLYRSGDIAGLELLANNAKQLVVTPVIMEELDQSFAGRKVLAWLNDPKSNVTFTVMSHIS